MARGALPVGGGQQADSSQLYQPDSDQARRVPNAPLAETPDSRARIDLLEDMVRKLEIALVTVMMQATQGKVLKELTAHEIQLACQKLGLRPDIADIVLARTRSYGGPFAPGQSDQHIPARMCPAFASHSECRGNACGLTCEAAPL